MLFSMLLPPFVAAYIYAKQQKMSIQSMLICYPMFIWIVNMIILCLFKLYVWDYYIIVDSNQFHLEFFVYYNLGAMLVSILLPSFVIYCKENYKFDVTFKRKELVNNNGKKKKRNR